MSPVDNTGTLQLDALFWDSLYVSWTIRDRKNEDGEADRKPVKDILEMGIRAPALSLLVLRDWDSPTGLLGTSPCGIVGFWPPRELRASADLCKGDRQRDEGGMPIAVTPIKIEMISAGITQPISIQFSIIRNRREGERERMRARTLVPTKNKRGSTRPKRLVSTLGSSPSFASENGTQEGRQLLLCHLGAQHIIFGRFWHLT